MLNLIICLCLGFAMPAFSQGTAFENLNFESANVSDYSPGYEYVPISQAIPGWSAYTVNSRYGSIVQTSIWYDTISGGGSLIAINDTNLQGYPGPLQGNYSAWLFAGPDYGAATISQTGLVPANAQSIQMDVALPFGNIAPWFVALDGVTISMSPLQTLPNYTIYGGNVAPYAGQTETLTITLNPPTAPIVPPSAMELDDIQFSSQQVPEPQTWSLLLCAAAVAGLWCRRR